MLALPDLGEWVRGQTNRPLLSEREVDVAVGASLMLGLPLHRDRWKCWDNLLGVWHASGLERDAPILDAGAVPGDSVFLPALSDINAGGSFWGININQDGSDGRILYDRRDMTATGFPDQSFAFVASLSTIEHGVDVGAFLGESARILRLGGKLFISFDYWEDAIDCGGREAFGAPVKIFDRYDVWSIVANAAVCGLRLAGEVETKCQDRVVEWLGLRYTFHNLLFERV